MDWLYSSLLGVALLVTSPYWLVRMLLQGKYRAGLRQRFGRVPATLVRNRQPAIWIHAVSVGEVLAIAPLARRLSEMFPGSRVVFSTTTRSGQELAFARFGDGNVFYFPLDFGFCIRPFLRALRPSLILVAETEFWPNFLRLAKASGALIAVVNARVSDRSFPRYRRVRALLRRVLAQVDLFCAQSARDAERLAAIGAAPPRIHVSGNLKFNSVAPAESAFTQQLRTAMREGGARPAIVCGSTVEGEEAGLLQGFARAVLPQFPNALLLLAPRHPERFAAAAELVTRMPLALTRRSEWRGKPVAGGVFLLDSIGELAALYALADVAVVGGAFANRGGHNILEPARYARPIVIGPHYQNFRDVVEQFREAQAVAICAPGNAMAETAALLRNPNRAAAMGQSARAVMERNSGALDQTLQLLAQLCSHAESASAASASERQLSGVAPAETNRSKTNLSRLDP